MTQDIPEAYAALTGDGTVDGYVTVASNLPFYPGALAWLWSDNAGPTRVKIVSLLGTDKVRLRAHGDLNGNDIRVSPEYGFMDCSAFLVADDAKINQEAQLVPALPVLNKAILV